MENRVITISREYGSGGRMGGRKLAEKLGIHCYDADLIQRIVDKSGYSADYVKEEGESAAGGVFSTFLADRTRGMTTQDNLWNVQCQVIAELADKESCVIVGRCADYALAGDPNMVSVFVTAEEEDKLKALMDAHQVSKDKAREIMLKTDKRRSSYYNYYSNKRWGDSKSYDLCINSSKCTLEGAVDVILAYAEIAKKYRG